MRKLFVSAAFLSLMTLPSVINAASFATTTLSVNNMTCALCPVTVKKALLSVRGVSSANVDLKTKTAIIQYDPSVTTPEALIQATTNAGYPAIVKK